MPFSFVRHASFISTPAIFPSRILRRMMQKQVCISETSNSASLYNESVRPDINAAMISRIAAVLFLACLIVSISVLFVFRNQHGFQFGKFIYDYLGHGQVVCLLPQLKNVLPFGGRAFRTLGNHVQIFPGKFFNGHRN